MGERGTCESFDPVEEERQGKKDACGKGMEMVGDAGWDTRIGIRMGWSRHETGKRKHTKTQRDATVNGSSDGSCAPKVCGIEWGMEQGTGNAGPLKRGAGVRQIWDSVWDGADAAQP